MTQHIPHALDSLILAVTTIAAAASTVALAETPQTSVERMDVMLLMLPLVGALICTAGCWLMNPAQETRRITMARCLFALFFGMMAPSALVMIWPALAPYNVKPVFLLGTGAAISFLVFILSRPFFSQFYARADSLGKNLADQVASKLPGSEKDKP